MKNKEYICVSCKRSISQEELYRVHQKDAKGNLLFTTKGKPKYTNYHNKCYENVQKQMLVTKKENEDRRRLFDYIKEKYFFISFPKEMAHYINNIRHDGTKFNHSNKKNEGYKFDIIYKLLIKLEPELLPTYKRLDKDQYFKDDMHKVNFIIMYIMKEIDSFARSEESKSGAKIIEVNQENITNSAQNEVIQNNTNKRRNKYMINQFIGQE